MLISQQSAQQRGEAARRREKRAREQAKDKRARGEDFLACLFELSADHQAAKARFADTLAVHGGPAVRKRVL